MSFSGILDDDQFHEISQLWGGELLSLIVIYSGRLLVYTGRSSLWLWATCCLFVENQQILLLMWMFAVVADNILPFHDSGNCPVRLWEISWHGMQDAFLVLVHFSISSFNIVITVGISTVFSVTPAESKNRSFTFSFEMGQIFWSHTRCYGQIMYVAEKWLILCTGQIVESSVCKLFFFFFFFLFGFNSHTTKTGQLIAMKLCAHWLQWLDMQRLHIATITNSPYDLLCPKVGACKPTQILHCDLRQNTHS